MERAAQLMLKWGSWPCVVVLVGMGYATAGLLRRKSSLFERARDAFPKIGMTGSSVRWTGKGECRGVRLAELLSNYPARCKM